MTVINPLLPEIEEEKIMTRNVMIFDNSMPVISQIRETTVGDAIIIPAALKTETTVRNAASRAASGSETTKYVVQKAYVVTRVS